VSELLAAAQVAGAAGRGKNSAATGVLVSSALVFSGLANAVRARIATLFVLALALWFVLDLRS
jgi:hypothetical protein